MNEPDTLGPVLPKDSSEEKNIKNYYVNIGRKIIDLSIGFFVGIIFCWQFYSMYSNGIFFGQQIDFYTQQVVFRGLMLLFFAMIGLFFFVKRKFISVGLLTSFGVLILFYFGIGFIAIYAMRG